VTTDYEHFLATLLVDLVAISLLTYALYFRRHQRRDLTLGFMGVNVGLFAVSSFTATSTISIGFGIGLFALLSVIRLRSTTASQEEIGYYFVALVIGLVNGLATEDQWAVAITLNVVLLGVMFVADHPRMLPHTERHLVVLKGVPVPLASLRGKLEDRLGYEVTRLRVLEMDYSNKRTRVDVRFNTDRPVEPPADHKADHEAEHRADPETGPEVDGGVDLAVAPGVDTADGAPPVTLPEEVNP
jgi:hypothetical protein